MSDPLDAVPEADRQEQARSTGADEAPEPLPDTDEVSEADLLDQARPAPLPGEDEERS